MNRLIESIRRYRKYIFALLIIILLVIIASRINPNTRSGYIFGKVQKTSLTEVVSESGNVISDGNTLVYSPTNGVIENVYVKNGDAITIGQNLFKVTSSASEDEKQSARANYLGAKATLDSDNARLYSLQSIMYSAWDKHFNLATNSKYQNSDGSPNFTNRALPEYSTAYSDWLAAEANYKNQQGIISRDKAALSAAYIQYQSTQNTIVKASAKGIVDNISFSVGDSVKIMDPILNSSSPALIIKSSNELKAVIQVGQTNIAKIREGQTVIIKPDAYKDKEYSGTITRIDNLGRNMDGVVTYNVYASITDSDHLLKSGMTFDCDITTKSLDDVLTIPNSAITIDKGNKSVRIIENNKLVFIPVVVGIKGETRTQILSGLSDSQEIIVSLTNEKAERPGFLGL